MNMVPGRRSNSPAHHSALSLRVLWLWIHPELSLLYSARPFVLSASVCGEERVAVRPALLRERPKKERLRTADSLMRVLNPVNRRLTLGPVRPDDFRAHG